MAIHREQARSPWPGTILIALVALALRAGYLYYYSGLPDWNWLTVDNWYHHNWAGTIADGDLLGGTTYFRAPLYVWLLGLLYAVFGASIWVARLFGLALGVVAPLLTRRLAERVYSPSAGLIAGLLHACYPVAIYFDLELLLDPLFTVLLQLCLLALMRWWDRPGSATALLTGLAFGLASLARPTALVLAAAVLAIMLLRTAVAARFKEATLCTLGLMLVIAPVTIRNVAVADDPVLIASQGGINFFIGNNDASDGVSAVLPQPYGHNWQLADIVYEAEKVHDRTLRPGEVSAYWTDRAIDWIEAHPSAFLTRSLAKVGLQFSNEEFSNNRNLAEFFNRVPLLKWNPLSFGVLVPLAVLGLVGWRDNRKLWVLILLLLLYVVAGSVFFVNARFRLAVLPLYFVLAAGGTVSLPRLIPPTRPRSLLLILLALVAGFASFQTQAQDARQRGPVTLLARAGEAFGTADFSRALGLYRQAYAVDPMYPEVSLGLGAAFFRLGSADSARYYFTREIALHPQRVKGYTNLASLLLVSGDTVGSAQLCSSARSVRPFDPLAWRLTLRAAVGLPGAQLVALADSAGRATHDNIYVLNEAATALTNAGLTGEAERILKRAIESTPPPVEMNDDAFTREFATGPRAWNRQRADSHNQLGFLYGQSGRAGLSVSQSRLALSCDSTLIAAWINLASGLVALGERAAADSVFTEAVARFGHDRLAPYLR